MPDMTPTTDPVQMLQEWADWWPNALTTPIHLHAEGRHADAARLQRLAEQRRFLSIINRPVGAREPTDQDHADHRALYDLCAARGLVKPRPAGQDDSGGYEHPPTQRRRA